MSWLAIFQENEPRRRSRSTSDATAIARELSPWGVRFERWPCEGRGIDPLVAHAQQIEALRSSGYRSIDVVRVAPDASDPAWASKALAMREKFRDEHTHAEDEVRFFAHGAGVFYLRRGGHVYCLRCEAGDLLSVPAGMRHWFDMGAVPEFVAIRFFASDAGWVGDFTGESIARRFPSFDELSADAAAEARAALEPA